MSSVLLGILDLGIEELESGIICVGMGNIVKVNVSTILKFI
jgi:hypothetical protein